MQMVLDKGIFNGDKICDCFICTSLSYMKEATASSMDDMGYVLRLCVVRCNCGKIKQDWIDSCKQISHVVLKRE